MNFFRQTSGKRLLLNEMSDGGRISCCVKKVPVKNVPVNKTRPECTIREFLSDSLFESLDNAIIARTASDLSPRCESCDAAFGARSSEDVRHDAKRHCITSLDWQ